MTTPLEIAMSVSDVWMTEQEKRAYFRSAKEAARQSRNANPLYWTRVHDAFPDLPMHILDALEEDGCGKVYMVVLEYYEPDGVHGITDDEWELVVAALKRYIAGV